MALDKLKNFFGVEGEEDQANVPSTGDDEFYQAPRTGNDVVRTTRLF